jgi:two-component system OmpR family response regulator
VMTRERILDETRGVDWEAYDRSVDILVSRLRQKLGDDARRPRYIRTVRGTGYRFIGGSDAPSEDGAGDE